MNRRTSRCLIAVLLPVLLLGAIVGSTSAQGDTPGRTTLSGTLAKDGDRYLVDGRDLDVGPAWYVAAASAEGDYDGDGAVGTVAAELDGLVGTTVVLEGEIDRCGAFAVFTIDGQPYRSAGRPPWAGGPKVVGAIHPGARGLGNADGVDDADGEQAPDRAGRPPGRGHGRPPWAGTGQGKPEKPEKPCR